MYNKELQKINTPEKAYLFGLFYADGNIGLPQIQSRLSLKLEDKDIIFKLKTLFPFFHIFYDRKTKIGIGSYKKEVHYDFINNGCLPRKSFENRNNLHIPNINISLYSHFIRGYFDGNGGCALSINNNKIQKRVYIYSTSFFLLKEISLFLLNINIKNNISLNKESEINVYKLTINTNSYKIFYDFLYFNVDLYIKRKKDKYEEILQTNFFIKNKILNCKFCNSINTVCDGFYTYKEIRKQRHLCKDCKRHFNAPSSSNITNEEDELLEN